MRALNHSAPAVTLRYIGIQQDDVDSIYIASLLSDYVRVTTKTVKKIEKQGATVNIEFNNRTRSVKKRIYSITKVLKRCTNETRQDVKEITKSILATTREVAGQAEQALAEAKKYIADQADVAAAAGVI
jgi:hypothetical protein